VSSEEASTVFGDTLSITIDDPLHSQDEDRLILIGLSEDLKTLVVVHVEKRETIRIISARKASKKEKQFYKENKV